MTSIWQFILAHQTVFALVSYAVLSAAIGSLPMPDNTSGKFYRWFFQFANTIAANLSRVSASFGTQGQQNPQKGDPVAQVAPPKP